MHNFAQHLKRPGRWLPVSLLILLFLLGCGLLNRPDAATPTAAPVVEAPTNTATVTPLPPTATATVTAAATETAVGTTPTSEAMKEDTPTPVVPAGEDELAAARAQVEANVIEIRELEALQPVNTVLLTREELRQRIEDDLFAEFTEEDAREATVSLHTFDFVPLDFDYYNFTLDLYTEQIAGYYDTELNEFYVISEDNELDVLEQWIHAHEYVHALQDQHFDLDALEEADLDAEASSALLALIEGEAVLVQNLYLLDGYFTLNELGEILELSQEIETSVLDSGPPVLANDLAFPYTAGYEFAQALFDEGGFEAINDAWDNPPVSTEQILHPERYLAGDVPQLVAVAPLTDTLGVGWRMLEEETLGEFFLNEYLIQQLPAGEAMMAAAGWGGDRYAVYWQEDSEALVMMLHLAWDSAADSDEFADAYMNYVTALTGEPGRAEADDATCWQGDDVICFYRFGDNSFVVRAPDLALVQAIAALHN